MKNQIKYHNEYVDMGEILDDPLTPQDYQDLKLLVQVIWSAS